jgi:hypothetical protein
MKIMTRLRAYKKMCERLLTLPFGSLKNEWIGDKIYESLEAGKKDVSNILKCFTIVSVGMHHWVM